MANKERLEQLAQRVEEAEDFDQYEPSLCVVGIAQKMVAEALDIRSHYQVSDHIIAEFFDIKVKDVSALFYAHYELLGIDGLENLPWSEVTQDIAAHVVRKLAERG